MFNSKKFLITFSVLIMSLAASYLVFAVWTEPGQAPPGGNVLAPINVSGAAQTKIGNLTLPNLYLNATGSEGDIFAIDELIGNNDLRLRGKSDNNATIYIEGNPVLINNDSGTGGVGIGTSAIDTNYKLTITGNTTGVAGTKNVIKLTAPSGETGLYLETAEPTGTIAPSVTWKAKGSNFDYGIRQERDNLKLLSGGGSVIANIEAMRVIREADIFEAYAYYPHVGLTIGRSDWAGITDALSGGGTYGVYNNSSLGTLRLCSGSVLNSATDCSAIPDLGQGIGIKNFALGVAVGGGGTDSSTNRYEQYVAIFGYNDGRTAEHASWNAGILGVGRNGVVGFSFGPYDPTLITCPTGSCSWGIGVAGVGSEDSEAGIAGYANKALYAGKFAGKVYIGLESDGVNPIPGGNPGDLWIDGGKVGMGIDPKNIPSGTRMYIEAADTVGIRYNKLGSRDARIQIGDPGRTWGLAVGWATQGDFSIIEEGVAGDRLYIKQGGNVGIGFTNPSQRLDVSGYVRGSTGLCIGSECRTSWPAGGGTIGGSGGINYIPKFTAATTIGNSLIYDNGTNVGIGTASPCTNCRLDVNGFIAANGSSAITSRPPAVTGGLNTGWKIGLYSDYYAIGIAPWTTALLTDQWVSIFDDNLRPAQDGSSGQPDSNAGIALGADGRAFFNNTLAIRNNIGTASSDLCYSTYNLVYGAPIGTREYFIPRPCASSIRYKENISSLTVDKEKVFQLQPVSFKWKDRDEWDIGLIAEEVEPLIPELVTYNNGQTEGVKYKQLSLYLLEILKGQEAEIKRLNNALESVTQRIEALEGKQ